MDDINNVSSSGANNIMFMLDGLNVLSGFGPDILQQALEEVTCDVDVPITTASQMRSHHEDHVSQESLDIDISRLLNSPITTSVGSIRGESCDSLLDHLTSMSNDHLSSASQGLGVKNGLLSTTISHHQHQQRSSSSDSKTGLMTLFNPEEGTLSLSLETARSLGIEVGGNPGHLLEQVPKSPATLSSPSAVLNSSAVMNSSAVTMNSPSVVLSNSTITDGTFAYILRAAPPPTWTPTSVMKTVSNNVPILQQSINSPIFHQSINSVRPAVNVVRPTVVGNAFTVHTNNSSVLTSVLRPVMTTGIARSGHQPRHQPVLLPKQPSSSYNQNQLVVPVAQQKNKSVMMLKPNIISQQQHQQQQQQVQQHGQQKTQFIVTSSSASSLLVQNSNSGAPIGTSQNPIHLFQEGSTLRSLHPLTNLQVTQIAKALKEKTQAEAPSSVVCDNGPNSTRIIYKIVYPEDVLPDLPATKPAKRTAMSGDTSDEDSYEECESPPQIPREMVYTPEELQRMHHLPPVGRGHSFKGRKRGRPRGDEAIITAMKAAGDHTKKLRTEFGLTGAQALKLEKDIVDDRLVRLSNRAQPDEDDEEADKALAVSITRSGRMSRPPTQHEDDEYQYRASAVAQKTADVTVDENPQSNLHQQQQQTPVKPKRKLSVPPRYRCRVCHKTYLGDRKMNRHVKLFPTHGPCDEPEHPSVVSLKNETSRKISSALSTMPIIPLARTQLEELVKNLDAELVLDVVSKKMFDNFSMWELQLKKMSQSKDKGVKVIDRLFKDTEKVLSEMKKLVDSCLTDTKLCDEPCLSVVMGEYLQLALSGHDGPWYLEKPNHIPEEYHLPLGIEPLSVSPRSESNDVTSVILHPDDDNSNSMMSGTSEPPRQMVLKMEKNLGARSRLEDMDDDTQDFGSPSKKCDFTGIKVEDTLSPASQDEEEEEDEIADQSRKTQAQSSVATKSPTETLGGELAMEIDSLNNMSRQHHENHSSENDNNFMTRLPSFSSIIGNNSIATTTCSSEHLHSTSVSDLGLHVSHMLHEQQHEAEIHSRGSSMVGIHSRRSSIDNEGLIIHESHPGSRRESPVTSRRPSVDHDSIMHHLSDRRSSVDQSLLSGNGLSLLSGNQISDSSGLSDLSSHHLSIPFMTHHDPTDGCRMTGSDPPTPANGLHSPSTGLHSLCGILDQSSSMSRHYHSMPNSPRPQIVTSSSALESLSSFVEKRSSTISVTEDDLMSLSIKTGNGIMAQLTINADMDTSTTVTFTDHQPILSLSPAKRSMPSPPCLPDIDKRPETPVSTTPMTSCSLPPPTTHSGVSQDSSSSTSHFLSDLESVLGDSADFSFANSLKTPEKLFHSIPPMMAMTTSQHLKKTPSTSQLTASSSVSTAPVRIDFLGAIEKNDLANLNSQKLMSNYSNSSVQQSHHPLSQHSSSLLNSSLHNTSHFTDSSVTPDRDSLSQLFDEEPPINSTTEHH